MSQSRRTGLKGSIGNNLRTVLTIAYAIILYFLLEPGLLREVNRSEVRTIEKQVDRPVIKEVIKNVDRPVVQIKEVIKEVPVYRDVIKTVEKPVIKEVIRNEVNKLNEK